MNNQEDNLDDVIASLLDFEEEEQTTVSEEERTLTGEPVTLTERAAKQVHKIKGDEHLDSNLYLRVAVEGGGCSGLSYKLGLDNRQENDTMFESHGIEMVVVRFVANVRYAAVNIGICILGFCFCQQRIK